MKAPDIDITITAVARPEILYKTLDSFTTNMFRFYPGGLNLIMNIDPVGGSDRDVRATAEVAKSFFPSGYRITTPDEPSFPKAFIKCWESVKSPYVFHLEDDWELLRLVDIHDMVGMLASDPELAILRLPAFHSGPDYMKNWNKFYPWNGAYFECPTDLRLTTGFCGHPSLIKREFVTKNVAFLNPNRNPEKQFHHGHHQVMRNVAKYNYGVYGAPNETPYVKDIGRHWLVGQPWKKKGNKAHFTEWEKTEC